MVETIVVGGGGVGDYVVGCDGLPLCWVVVVAVAVAVTVVVTVVVAVVVAG